MFDAIRAEAFKLRQHRATWLMVWIYPVGFALLILVTLARDLLHGAVPVSQPGAAAMWIEQSTVIWRVPLSSLGRFLIAGFAALVFAGEFGWNTWKLIIPARARWQLIAAKWLVTFGFVFSAFAAADLLNLSGIVARALLGGPAMPAGVTIAAIADVHASAAAQAVVPILYTLVWAGMIAVLTTSVLATVGVSIAIIVLEQMLLPIGGLAYAYAPATTWVLLKALPFYHVANLLAWAKGGPLTLPIGAGAIVTAGWGASLAIALAWIGAIGALTIMRFARQDLN